MRVLQLENQLEQERVRLGELRKQHYELVGPEDSLVAVDAADSFPPPPPPTLLDSSGGSQAFPNTQPYLNTQSISQTNPFSLPTSQPFAPAQSYTPASLYSQQFTSSQAYTPPQAYILSQPYTSLPTQSYLKPQSFPPSPSTTSSPRPNSPSIQHKTSQSGPAETKSTSKRSNIFTKSGNLLKNAVSLTVTNYIYLVPCFNKRLNMFVFSSSAAMLEQENPENQDKDLKNSSCFLPAAQGVLN